uniref:Uncharacterized protein n=1 Tax=Rhizophora mucronata TaxID=61149 RepID=A0A2P2JBX3_RHIMU
MQPLREKEQDKREQNGLAELATGMPV